MCCVLVCVWCPAVKRSEKSLAVNGKKKEERNAQIKKRKAINKRIRKLKSCANVGVL